MFTGELSEVDLTEVRAVRDGWMAVALSTERVDRPAAEAAVHAAYVAAGMEPPAVMVWMDSPLGGTLASAALRGQLRDQIRDQLRGQIRDQLWDQLAGQLERQILDQLGDQLAGQLRGQLERQLGDQLWDQLAGQLRGQLERQLGDQLRDQLAGQLAGQLRGQLERQLGGQLGGQLRGQLAGKLRGQLRDQLADQLADQLNPWSDAYWLAYYACASPQAGLKSDRLASLAAAVRSCGWWWPMRGAAVLTDRPTLIDRDEQGNLHGGSGPALTYADGYVCHFWHGTAVPPDFYEWDITRVLQERNAEVRRCGVERIGWDAVIDRLELVAEAPDPGNTPHTLRLYDMGAEFADLYKSPARILVCQNASLDRGGHRRTFGLPVPAHHTDPVSAAAELFGVPVAAYRALERAT